MTLPIALQLYTVRDETAKDFAGTLKKLADMGYEYVELAGTGGLSPAEAAKVLADLGLTPTSSHHGLMQIRDEFNAVIDQAKLMNYELVVCPSLPGDMQNTDGFKQAADVIVEANEKGKEHNITFCYHNHSFEWADVGGGKRGIDVLYDNPNLQSELDIYWVQHGGDDPLAWMKKLSGRVPLLHVKDMKDNADRDFAEVGTGTVDTAGAVALAEACGVMYLIIEQDRCWINDSPMESVKISLDNLKKIVATAG